MKTCSESGCGHSVKAHGLCDTHYIRPSRRRVCERCCQPFVATSGKGQRFCSQTCWLADRPATVPKPRASEAKPRLCLNCSVEYFLAGGRGSRSFCSVTCGQTHASRLKAARRTRPNCAECARPARKRGLCCTHYNRRYQPDRSHGPVTITEWVQRNPEKAARSAAIKRHRRRARQRGLPNEAIDRQVVGKRDGWRCGICRRMIDPKRAYPHPLSQSLDHIVPLSKGGHHTYANVRIAHLKCNTERGNRGGNEQLALIG